MCFFCLFVFCNFLSNNLTITNLLCSNLLLFFFFLKTFPLPEDGNKTLITFGCYLPFLPLLPPPLTPFVKASTQVSALHGLTKAHNRERKQIRLQESRFIRVYWVNQQLDQSQTIRFCGPWHRPPPRAKPTL